MNEESREHPSVSFEEAREQVLARIPGMLEAGGRLWIGGRPGAGKSRLLGRLAEETSAAVVDCRGKSAEQVAHDVAIALGTSAPYTFDDGLYSAVQRVDAGRVVVLVNAQWAGQLRTSVEANRVARQIAAGLPRATRYGVGLAVLIEWSGADDLAARYGDASVILAGGSDAHGPSSLSANNDDQGAVSALSLAELPEDTFATWELLCEAGGTPRSRALLRELADRLPDLLQVTEGDGRQGDARVSFRRESDARQWRAEVPQEQALAFHSSAIRLLSSAPELSSYAASALPAHAAAVDALEELVSHPSVLAQLSPEAVFEALSAAYYGRPIAPSSRCASLHYLLERGISPCSQEEWVAILHHLAIGTGDTDTATALTQQGMTLPWQTRWMQGVPAGMYDTDLPVRRPEIMKLRLEHDAEAIDQGVVVCTSYSGAETTWRVADGAPTSPPSPPNGQRVVIPALYQSDAGWPYPDGPAAAALIPRMDSSVRHGLRKDGLAVLGGADGVFAVSVNPEAIARQPRTLMKRMLRPVTRIAARPTPPQAFAPTRQWLEASLGEGCVRPLTEDQLPDGLSHAPTRRFLTTVGLPAVSGFLELETTDLAVSGLETYGREPEEWDTELPEDVPLYQLGEWQSAQLLLDGASGQVLQDGASGLYEPLAASSLQQFVAMVRLYHWWFTSDWTIEDVKPELREWLRAIDEDAIDSEAWQRVFSDETFADRL
ncbi:hypothetical protein ADL21_09520 [Streptomyces albus subsp. albus]|nr:hypothetical protein ADL21_09520 [Streptomyces albus subsp. albus]